MHHADGGWRYVEAIGNNLLADPAVEGMVVTTRDVTDRHEAEEAMRVSEARFRSLVQRSYDVIAVCDPSGTVLYVTPSVELVLGYEPDDIVGTNGYDFAHPDDRHDLVDSLGRLLDGTSAQRAVEFRAVHKDGSLRWVELVPTNLVDDPAVGGIVLNVRDITERKRAEEELRLLQTIVLAIDEAPDLDAALEVTVQRVCEVTGWACGAAWTPLPDGSALQLRRSWSRDDPRLEAFSEDRQTLELPPGVGLPGRVWASGEPALSTNVGAGDARAGQAGLAVGVAVPVLADREVVAVLELFNVDVGGDDRRVLSLVATVASQLGTV